MVSKNRATTESELGESSGEFHDEIGGARLRVFAKYSATKVATAVATVAMSAGMGEARSPGFANYTATSVSASELVEMIITARKAFSHRG